MDKQKYYIQQDDGTELAQLAKYCNYLIQAKNLPLALSISDTVKNRNPENLTFIEIWVTSITHIGPIENLLQFFDANKGLEMRSPLLQRAYFDALIFESRYAETFAHVWNCFVAHGCNDNMSYFSTTLATIARYDAALQRDLEGLVITEKLNPLDRIILSFSELSEDARFREKLRNELAPVDRHKEAPLKNKYLMWRDMDERSKAFSRAQDYIFPKAARNAENIMVILVPEHDEMSGGIYSFFSIARYAHKMKTRHGREVLVMTRPSPSDLTYIRQSNFSNSENVFRFEQILLCKNCKDLIIHIPEYAASKFPHEINQREKEYLTALKNLSINILNQNILLMPEPEELQDLFQLTKNISQSVAHHAYFNQGICNKYRLPTLFLPAYTDLSEYTATRASDKDNLIIYSPDDAPHKDPCLERIKLAFPEYDLLEISNMTFEKFMEYATKCKFSITFGEGFDGYLAQPIHQGAISFAAFNEDFFPSREFLSFPNIFEHPEAMVLNICAVMKQLERDPDFYNGLNRRLVDSYSSLYSLSDYKDQLQKLFDNDFELYPQ